MIIANFRSIKVTGRWVAVTCTGVLACLCGVVVPTWAEEAKDEGVESRAVPITPLSMPAVTTMTTPTGAVQANIIYVSITGMKTGKFRGEISRKGYENKFAGLSIDYGEYRKPDPATGVPTGFRQYLPMKIKKIWGAASPQLFNAFTTNEVLSSVMIDFVGIDQGTGAEVLDHTITLANAVASAWSYQTENVNGQAIPVETIEFAFQRISLTDAKSQGMAMDDGILASRP